MALATSLQVGYVYQLWPHCMQTPSMKHISKCVAPSPTLDLERKLFFHCAYLPFSFYDENDILI